MVEIVDWPLRKWGKKSILGTETEYVQNETLEFQL